MDKRNDIFSIRLPEKISDLYKKMDDIEREQARAKMIRALAEHIDEAGRAERIKRMLGE